MPRKPRIDIPGYYHVVNRGVNRENIFPEKEDKEKFLEFVDISRERYQFTVHSFCVLDNHYHLLIETSRANLSLAIRYINSLYATYFNKQRSRIGPLWQGRFKSWPVYDENYLWLLVRYIEMNPVKAGLTQKAGDYPHSSLYFVINYSQAKILSGSCLYQRDLRDWILPLEENDLTALADFQSAPLKQDNGVVVVGDKIPLEDCFCATETRDQRNYKILATFLSGYKQSEIAHHLQLSPVAISRIVDQENKKAVLFRGIRDKGLFWSYAEDIEFSPEKSSLLIETVLKFADIDEIGLLFSLFGKRAVQRNWEQSMRYDPRFKKLNYFLARIFFNMDVEADEFDGVKNVRAEKLQHLAG